MKAAAILIQGKVTAKARIGSGVSAEAVVTDSVNLLKYLRVLPDTPQGLMWLTPQVGIDYTIDSNTNWHII